MGENKLYLIDRELLGRAGKYWSRGGIGVLYTRLPPGGEAVRQIVREWTAGNPHVFWHSRLGRDCFFFLRRLEEGASLSLRLEESRRQLTSLLSGHAGRGAAPLTGTAMARPTGSGRSAETALYQALKEALWSARDAGPGEGRPMLPEEPRVAQALASVPGEGRIGGLAAPIPAVERTSRVSEVADLFEHNPQVQGAVIVDGDRPVGLLVKEKLHQLLAGQFGLPLYWNRAVERIMDEDPLIVDADMSVEQVSQLAMARAFHKLYDVVIITREGRIAGAASIRSILESITAIRTEAARTANPLTGLPGNEGIQRELHRRIEARKPFAVIYADLDFFKWYNDCFGFRRGDEMIRYTADVLLRVVRQSGTDGDFVGHIGGDDFLVISGALDPETICRHVIWRFDGGVKSFYDGAEVTTVTSRDGVELAREGVTISLCLTSWDGSLPVTPDAFSRLSAQLKKKAKQRPGSAYVMEQLYELRDGEEQS